jgi:tetratricopeptide (TPR) repeat protein/transcriptional regulator with XRE-family HTH domain
MIAHLTQEELAERAGVSLRGVVALENGERSRPQRETVRLLAEGLGLVSEERARFEASARRIESPAKQWAVHSLGSDGLPDSSSVPFIGRARELELVEWHLAGQGPPMLVFAGEPGIGKTRLLRHAVDRVTLHQGCVLVGGCQRRSGQEPYAPLPQAIGRHLRRLSPLQRAHALRDCHWLARLLPEFAPDFRNAPSPPVAAEQERRLVFGAAGRLLANLAGLEQVVLVLDDMQWAPDDALDLLVAVLHDPTVTGVRIICTYRSTEVQADHSLSVMLADLAHAGLARQHTVDPLTPDEARQLLVSLLDEPDRLTEPAEQAIARTGGVPFYLLSYAQELRLTHRADGAGGNLPWDVAQSIRQRVASSSALTREILGVASVVGRVVPRDLLRSLVACPETELLDALDAACRTRLLVEDGEFAYQFAHDVIREVVETDLGAARRSALHRLVAETLEIGPGQPPPDTLAYHYARSDRPDKALEYLAQAAERAEEASAYQQQVDLLAQAIRVATKIGRSDVLGDLHARRGMAFFALTRWGEARAEMESALDHVSRASEGSQAETMKGPETDQGSAPVEHLRRRAEVLVGLAMACHWSNDAVHTRLYAAEALRLAEELEREDLAVAAMSALVLADSSDGKLRTALRRYRQAAGRAGDRHPGPLSLAVEMASLVLYWRADYEDAIARGRDALTFARAAHDTTTIARTLGNIGCALSGSGKYREALDVFAEAEQFAVDLGAINWRARSTAMRGGLHLELFDFPGAELLAEEARELSRSGKWKHADISGGIDLVLNFTRRGEIDRAERIVDELVETIATAQGAHGWLWRLRYAQAQAEIAAHRGDHERSLMWAENVIKQSRALGRVKYEVAGLHGRALALDAQGNRQEAIVTLRAAVDRARSTHDPAMLLKPAASLLAIDGSDTVLAEARSAVARIVTALPHGTIVDRFQDAGPVRAITGF